jgi:hypothetical protein
MGEEYKGLPVRRLQAASSEEQPRVFAYKSEVDAWWQEHQTKLTGKAEKEALEDEESGQFSYTIRVLHSPHRPPAFK